MGKQFVFESIFSVDISSLKKLARFGCRPTSKLISPKSLEGEKYVSVFDIE